MFSYCYGVLRIACLIDVTEFFLPSKFNLLKPKNTPFLRASLLFSVFSPPLLQKMFPVF